MSNSRYNKTVYAEYVFSNVKAIIVGQGQTYNINDLARVVGLKPTNNFKRRVNQMVSEGLICAYPVFSPRGGMMKVYTSPLIEEEIEAAF
jgi:hypothetical protein